LWNKGKRKRGGRIPEEYPDASGGARGEEKEKSLERKTTRGRGKSYFEKKLGGRRNMKEDRSQEVGIGLPGGYEREEEGGSFVKRARKRTGFATQFMKTNAKDRTA